MPRLLASAQQCGHSRHVGGVLLDDVQCDHQYGECNTKRRGLTATILGADVSVSEQLSEEQS